MHTHRVCCCFPGKQCCAVYPVWCFSGEGCSGCWNPLYRTGVYQAAEITVSYFGTDFTLAYAGVTQALDATTGDPYCGFPDPQEYPYEVPQPGSPPAEIFPYNYGVPIFAGTTDDGASVEVVWPIWNKHQDEQNNCGNAVLGFEVRGGDFIQKLLGNWGTSPDSLTGCANGTGEHWYLTTAGTLRYFGDLGRWKSRNSGYGPGFQFPFHIQDKVHNLNPARFTISTHNWCKENGECLELCRCNHSWPEHKHCCRDLEVHFDLNWKTVCGTQTLQCAATFRTDWYPSTCQYVYPIPYLNGGTHYPFGNPNLPGGNWSLDIVSRGLEGCCTINTATFDPPDVVAVKFGCNLTLSAISDPCDPPTGQTWDFVALITGFATATYTDCDGIDLIASSMYIAANFRNCGDGCCLEEMEPDEIWVLDFLTIPGQCVWRQVSGTIHFQKRAGLC